MLKPLSWTHGLQNCLALGAVLRGFPGRGAVRGCGCRATALDGADPGGRGPDRIQPQMRHLDQRPVG